MVNGMVWEWYDVESVSFMDVEERGERREDDLIPYLGDAIFIPWEWYLGCDGMR